MSDLERFRLMSIRCCLLMQRQVRSELGQDVPRLTEEEQQELADLPGEIWHLDHIIEWKRQIHQQRAQWMLTGEDE